jgi:hypothetical protein
MAFNLFQGGKKPSKPAMPPPEFPGSKKSAKPKPKLFAPKKQAPPSGVDEPDPDEMGGPPDMDADDSGMPPAGASDDSGKVSRESAHPVLASEHCSDCANYDGSSSCSKVAGSWQPDDACVKYFEAKSGSGDEDTPDMEQAA